MKDEKKSSYFNRVEDKYVFRISTSFWHLLIGAITVTAIIGIVLFIYSLIPSSKNEIKASIDKPDDILIDKDNSINEYITKSEELRQYFPSE